MAFKDKILRVMPWLGEEGAARALSEALLRGSFTVAVPGGGAASCTLAPFECVVEEQLSRAEATVHLDCEYLSEVGVTVNEALSTLRPSLERAVSRLPPGSFYVTAALTREGVALLATSEEGPITRAIGRYYLEGSETVVAAVAVNLASMRAESEAAAAAKRILGSVSRLEYDLGGLSLRVMQRHLSVAVRAKSVDSVDFGLLESFSTSVDAILGFLASEYRAFGHERGVMLRELLQGGLSGDVRYGLAPLAVGLDPGMVEASILGDLLRRHAAAGRLWMERVRIAGRDLYAIVWRPGDEAVAFVTLPVPGLEWIPPRARGKAAEALERGMYPLEGEALRLLSRLPATVRLEEVREEAEAECEGCGVSVFLVEAPGSAAPQRLRVLMERAVGEGRAVALILDVPAASVDGGVVRLRGRVFHMFFRRLSTAVPVPFAMSGSIEDQLMAFTALPPMPLPEDLGLAESGERGRSEVGIYI